MTRMGKTRYFTVSGNEEVFVGDTLQCVDKEETKHGKKESKETIEVTEENIPYLIEQGWIVAKDKKGEGKEEAPLDKDTIEDAADVLARIAMGFDWDFDEVTAFLEIVHVLNPASYRGIVYAVVSDMLGKGDDGLYYVSVWDKEIRKLKRPLNNDHEGMATFASHEDAEKAREVAEILMNCLED